MKVFGVLGDIGSGKSYVAKNFGFPVFNADNEVKNIYQKNNACFRKLRKKLPKYIKSFPIDKNELMNAILQDHKNLKIITKIVHPIVRSRMNFFIFKNKNKKAIILDIPLLLENKLNNKNMILIFVQAKKSEVLNKLNQRKNFNFKIYKQFKKIQLPLDIKKRHANFIIKNDFTKKLIKNRIKDILKKVLK